MEEKGRERVEKRHELFMGLKLKPGFLVGKRGGNCNCTTTPSPTWEISQNHPTFPSETSPSARKLGADLWELQNRRRRRFRRLKDGVSMNNKDGQRLRRHSRHNPQTDKRFQNPEPPGGSPGKVRTPNGSLKNTVAESSSSLKTSTDLLKILNRIWNLEEQHSSNISLIKSLKSELNHVRSQLKKLQQEKRSDRREIKEMAKKIAKKRVEEAVHSVKRERKSRVLLEELCDEFAKAITVYEREFRDFSRQNLENDRARRADSNRLILHISEAWIDERMQMKVGEKNMVLDKLRFEIEAFLRDKKSNVFGENEDLTLKKAKESNLLRMRFEEGVKTAVNSVRNPPIDEINEVNEVGTQNNLAKDHCFSMEGQEIVESSSLRQPPGVKEGSLKAKLLEARLERQLARSKPSKG